MAAPANGATNDDLYVKLEEVITALVGLTVEAPIGGATEVTVDRIADGIDAQNADTSTLPASPDSNLIYAGTTSLTPKFAKISTSASADLVALVASKKIRVLAYNILALTAVTVKFQSGATTDLTGAKPLGATGGICAPFNPVGWFETVAGEKLNLVLGSGVAVAGELVYVEV